MTDMVVHGTGSGSGSGTGTEPVSGHAINDMGTQLALERLDHEVLAMVKIERDSGRLTTDGRLRLTVRERMQGILKLAHMQLSVENRTLLLNTLGLKLLQLEECGFALECLTEAMGLVDAIPEPVRRIRTRVETMQALARAQYMQYGAPKACRLAPMSVSKILGCLMLLRNSVLLVFELPTPQLQEESAWQIVNGCKLIATVGQPLLWHSCGRYVHETFLLAAMCMESVINLCTARHILFRMKLYAGAFYAALTQGTTDSAAAIVAHVAQQLKELRQREELDPPIPAKIEAKLVQAESDLAVLRCALSFWKDPDAFSLSASALGALGFTTASEKSVQYVPVRGENCASNAERCFVEAARVQQQTAANPNEPWRKRSTSLLKGFWGEFQKIDVIAFVPDHVPEGSKPSPAAALDADDVDAPKPAFVVTAPFSMHALLEAACVALFDEVDKDVVPTDQVLAKVWAVVDAANQSEFLAETVKTQSFVQLKLVKDLVKVCDHCNDKTKDLKKRLKTSGSFIQRLEAYMHTDAGRRTPAFIQRVAMRLWSTFIYADLQTALSDEKPSYPHEKLRYAAPEQKEELEVFAPLLLAVARIYEVSDVCDPVLAASMSLTSARLLAQVGDHRSALALLRRALLNIEEERAARVDVALHQPEDPRDVAALQRLSFSTRADAQAWFHAEKRLGAHAFAGYGVFGSSSAADRVDQALAELHTDLTVSYFRIELQFGILQRRARAAYREKAAKLAAAPPPTAGSATAPAPAAPATAPQAFVGSATAAFLDAPVGTVTISGAEALPCVHYLRAFCGKNVYTKCLLLLELARVEEKEEAQREFLADAKNCIEDAEARELLLRDTFTDLTVMKDKDRVVPLVVARSHRWVYVCPVGCRRLRQKRDFDDDDDDGVNSVVAYYRVLAKEQGAGTAVSLSSTGYAGCEQKVPVSELNGPVPGAVKIEPLHNGERYVFASAGFNAFDKVIGACSPTSPPVDAVNPLPTILLWSYLSQTAVDCGANFGPLGKLAAGRVCARFYLKKQPTHAGDAAHAPLTLAKGVNVFLLDEEPALCSLAIQQASENLLRNFLLSFLLLESPSVPSVPPDPTEIVPPGFTVDLEVKKHKQIHVLTALRRTAAAATIACYLGSRELIVRCASLGYELAAELLVFDEAHLAQPLQDAAVGIAAALQMVPKRHWRDLEHQLYTRLLQHAVKASVVTRNTAPVLALLAQFYPEAAPAGRDGRMLTVMGCPVTPELQAEYLALAAVVRASAAGGLFLSPSLDEQLGALLATPPKPPSAPTTTSRPPSGTPAAKNAKPGAAAAAAAPAVPAVDFWAYTAAHRAWLTKGAAPAMLGIAVAGLASSVRPPSATRRGSVKERPPSGNKGDKGAPAAAAAAAASVPAMSAVELTTHLSKPPDRLSSLLAMLTQFSREIAVDQPASGPYVAKMLQQFAVNEKLVASQVRVPSSTF